MASAPWLDEVRRLLERVRLSDANEVEVVDDGFRLRVVRRPGHTPTAAETRLAPVVEVVADGTPLAAPLTGVFYRASTPGAPPFVSVGESIEAGAVVGLIETMKIFNEVLAERGGRIAAILAESGQLVHAGDALMMIVDAADFGSAQAQS